MSSARAQSGNRRDEIVHLDPRKKDSEPSILSLLAPEEVASGLAPPTTNQRINHAFAYTHHVLTMWAIVHDPLLSLVSTPAPGELLQYCASIHGCKEWHDCTSGISFELMNVVGVTTTAENS